MTSPDYKEIVERAQRGDTQAFSDLVTRFQDLAVGTAYAWLGDVETAKDVAQEAFFDAHKHLGSLREPAAFPGWFRQIVIKHCDRVTRRKQVEAGSLEEGISTLSEQGPEAIHTASEAAQFLRFAVDALPPQERIVVALQYFAEQSGADVSAFLELPVSTIKRRLRRARQRLREKGDSLMATTINNMRPSNTGQFAREVAFFIALRSGDRMEVMRLLNEAPELVETLQDWEPGLVHDGVLPFANKATPLITTIERGDLDMQTLLLDAGADVNGICGCATGEAPIWAATVLNRIDHARQLLERGADPNASSTSGNRPLHVAAMRGLTGMTELLLEFGADPDVLDSGTGFAAPWAPADGAETERRTPAQWAMANGHAELAALLTGAARSGQSVRAASASIGTRVSEDIIHTGIKALDLFAPLVKGGVVRVPFMAGVGMVVLLSELCHRFLAMNSGRAIWTGFAQPPFDVSDWEGDMAETGLSGRVESSLAGFDESPAARCEAYARGLERVDSLRASGHDVLAVILSTQGFENEVESSFMRLKTGSAEGSVTSLVVTPFTEKGQIWEELQPPYTGQIALDRVRAERHLYPAIHPRHSMSLALGRDLVGQRHVRLAETSRAMLDQHQQADPEFRHLETHAGEPSHKATQLARFLCQPFFATEPFTGRPGEQVAYDDLLGGVAAIVDS